MNHISGRRKSPGRACCWRCSVNGCSGERGRPRPRFRSYLCQGHGPPFAVACLRSAAAAPLTPAPWSRTWHCWCRPGCAPRVGAGHGTGRPCGRPAFHGFWWLEGLTGVPLAGAVGSFSRPRPGAIRRKASVPVRPRAPSCVRADQPGRIRNEDRYRAACPALASPGFETAAPCCWTTSPGRQGARDRFAGQGNRADRGSRPPTSRRAAGPVYLRPTAPGRPGTAPVRCFPAVDTRRTALAVGRDDRSPAVPLRDAASAVKGRAPALWGVGGTPPSCRGTRGPAAGSPRSGSPAAPRRPRR